MVSLMASAFALAACYALGPPGSLFFIMVAAIGAYTPLIPARFSR